MSVLVAMCQESTLYTNFDSLFVVRMWLYAYLCALLVQSVLSVLSGCEISYVHVL